MKHSATPSPDNPARPLQKSHPNALQDELIRHLNEDSEMSAFDFGVQFLDADRMTYWGKRQDANFWIENASADLNRSGQLIQTTCSCQATTPLSMNWAKPKSSRPGKADDVIAILILQASAETGDTLDGGAGVDMLEGNDGIYPDGDDRFVLDGGKDAGQKLIDVCMSKNSESS